MTPRASKPFRTHLRASDLRGLARLATQAVSGVTQIVEGVHQSVWGTLGLPGGAAKGQTRGITGLVYRSIHAVTRLVGRGVDAALGQLQPLFDAVDEAAPGTPQREAVLAALNGVLGDRLADDHSAFATRLTLRCRGEALSWPAPLPQAAGKVLLLVHGLCMNDLQWRTSHEGRAVDLGETLAQALGYTPVYLRYNSGLHISRNGRELAAQLEQLVAHWPVPIQELSVLAHSMGGLVTRSALHCAAQSSLTWPQHAKHVVFLGTPHHGAPLERAGSWVEAVLGSTPWSAPFAALAQLRSAGITDLRYGHVVDEDWQGRDRFRRDPDRRLIVPLPADVACHTVAATTASKRSLLADRLLGDGLVPLRSALGRHDDPRRSLAFASSSQWIAYRTTHLQLLSSPDVTRQLLQWLSEAEVPRTKPTPRAAHRRASRGAGV